VTARGRPPRRIIAATILLTAPMLAVVIALITFAAVHVAYIVAMVALLALIAFGLLRQRRWGWVLAVVMGFTWLLSGVMNFVAIVTSALVWASPLMAPLVACYVLSVTAALVLLVTPRGRAAFRPPAPRPGEPAP